MVQSWVKEYERRPLFFDPSELFRICMRAVRSIAVLGALLAFWFNSLAFAQSTDAGPAEPEEEPPTVESAAKAASRSITEALRISEAQQALLAAADLPDFQPNDASKRRNARLDVVRFVGNEAVLSPVLHYVLNLSTRDRATGKTARKIERRLQQFYRSTGYDLARVQAVVADQRIDVYIAEGKLAKVVFRGVSTIRAIDLQFDFSLPARVYNRYLIASEIRRFKDEYNLQSLRPELIERVQPGEPVGALGRLLPGFRTRDDQAVINELSGEYELVMHCKTKRSTGGFGFGIDILLPYGLRGRVGYDLYDAVLDDDRLELETSVAGDATQLFTRATADMAYIMPPVVGTWLRPNFKLRTSLIRFTRSDIGLGSYLLTDSSGSARLGLQFFKGLLLSFGVGLRHDEPFDVERTDETPGDVTTESRVQSFGVSELDINFEPSIIRRDQKHELNLQFSYYGLFENLPLLIGSLNYQKVFKFGYDDFYVRARGYLIDDNTTWRDETGLGSDIIRVIASEQSFAARMVQLGFEYRFSLVRDILKANIFVGGAVFDGIDLEGFDRNTTWTTAFGPGISALLIDAFGVDLYYAVGVDERGNVVGAINFEIDKVY